MKVINMENLIVSLNVVIPLFLSIGYGYFLKKINILSEDILYKLNTIIFHAFFPLLMFKNIYQTNIESVFELKLILYAVIMLIFMIVVLFITIPFIEKENAKRGVLIQAIYRSNFIIFGLSLVSSVYGEASTGITSILIAVIVPLFNIFAVIILEIFRGEKIHFLRSVQTVCKNPLIIGAVLGIIAMIFSIRLPRIIKSTISNFASITTPLALIILGGTFQFSSFHKLIKQLCIGVLGRLIIVPAIGLGIAILLGFRGIELLSLFAMFGSPIAISSYPMAQQMGGDGQLAGQLVVWTSAFSIITIFLWIFFMKSFGLI